jgi:hypothetical protein
VLLEMRIALIALALGLGARAEELSPETEAAFDRYVRQAESRIEDRVAQGDGFLVAATTDDRSRLRSGAIRIEPQLPRGELKVSSGLIHDWAGAVFVPDARIREVLDLVQSYDRHKEFYRPEVIDSRLLERPSDADFRVSLRLLKKKVLTVVLDTEHAVHYQKRDETRWWSRSRSTRIVEVRDPGKPGETQLAPGTGHGFLWRLNSYWTFQELDGGTYVECQAISLTRDIPRGLAWLIEPIIRSLPRESLASTLRATRDGVSAARKERR